MEFANNAGNTVAEIFVASGGGMNIQNKSAGNIINLQTADAGTGALVTRVSVDETSIIANKKVDTRAGIVGPVASLTYTSDMIGYTTTFVASSLTFVSDTTLNTVSDTIGIGVWLLNATQSILRGTGTFTVASQTQQLISVNSGTATISAISRLWQPIPSGATTTRITNYQTNIATITSPATFNIADTITMTVGTAKLTTGIVFTRIA